MWPCHSRPRNLRRGRDLHLQRQGGEGPSRRGFALRDAIINSQVHSGTWLGKAVAEIDRKGDRLIVFTDEQSHDQVPEPKARGTMVNVASYQHGVGHGAWTRVNGFSEAVVAWIAASETTLN